MCRGFCRAAISSTKNAQKPIATPACQRFGPAGNLAVPNDVLAFGARLIGSNRRGGKAVAIGEIPSGRGSRIARISCANRNALCSAALQ
jgi:hypothetical protein